MPKWFIIESESRNKQIWNMFTNIFYMVSFFNFPYVIAFNFVALESQFVFEIFLDVLLILDISTEFITTREKNGIKVFKVKDIMFSYMKSTFIFDVMACIPGLVTGESMPAWYLFKVFRYLQMPRFF